MKPFLNILFLLLAAHIAAAQTVPARPVPDTPVEIQLLTDYFALDSLESYCVAQGMDYDRKIDFYVVNSAEPFDAAETLVINGDVALSPSEYRMYDPYNVLIFDKDVMRRVTESFDGQYSDNPKCGPDEFMEQLYIQYELTLIKLNLYMSAAQNEFLQTQPDGQSITADQYLAYVDMQVNIDNLQMLLADVDRRVERLKQILAD